VNVPIVLTGVPDGVRVSGGILSQVMSELTIRCDPVNIPRRIEADVTHVLIGHSIHVSDLKAPEGVEIMDDADTTIAVVSAPKVEAEAPTAEAATTEGEPELIRKTKEEEEGESK